ncbi:MAG: hypothetical protein RSF94_07755, partial [Rikenellaceae bacterium]
LFSQIIMLETDKKVCFDEKNPLLTLYLSMLFNITSNLEAVLNFSSFLYDLIRFPKNCLHLQGKQPLNACKSAL